MNPLESKPVRIGFLSLLFAVGFRLPVQAFFRGLSDSLLMLAKDCRFDPNLSQL